MSAGMVEVIAAHDHLITPFTCKCGAWIGPNEQDEAYDPEFFAAHVADELAKAGYGRLPGGVGS